MSSNPQARSAFIAKSDLHPALEFSRVPVHYVEREEIKHAMDIAGSVRKRCSLLLAFLKTHLVNWNATGEHLFDPDPKLSSLPLSADSIGKLHPVLVDRLYLIVMGAMAGDGPPAAASEEEVDEFAANLLKAATEGVAVGDVEEATTVKN